MIAETQNETLSFLQDRNSYPHAVSGVAHIETHISHLFLTGEYAYKLKKSVLFNFLDFTTVEKREHFCREELRLNSRFAAELYLEVLPISRQDGKLTFGPGTEIVDYVIKMRQFEEGALFEELAARDELRSGLLVQITDAVAQLHRTAEHKPAYWSSNYVEQTIRANFDVCAEFCPHVLSDEMLQVLRKRADATFSKLRPLIDKRQLTHVRAVHGDLHLRNMCVFQDRAMLFDGIEFNPELSNCDVWADFAFFVMDLLFRGRTADASLVLNHYLQETDDYEGMQLLDLYASYRAAVRAMVSCLALETAHSPIAYNGLSQQAAQYLLLALQFFEPRRRGIIAVGGLAGTGKSTLSSLLAQHVQAVHLRSDAVRKHLFGVPLTERAPQEAYSFEMNRKTYRGLLERVHYALESNRPVIVDAVFHSPEWRGQLRELADDLRVPFTGIWCKVSPKMAKERVRMRVGDISDADESIVSLQETYSLGEIDWHHLDTAQHEKDAAAQALQWISLSTCTTPCAQKQCCANAKELMI